MNVQFDFPIDADDRMVYVRPVDPAELPEEVLAELADEAIDTKSVYAIHDADGERIALARDRAVAFAVARTNEFKPVSVH